MRIAKLTNIPTEVIRSDYHGFRFRVGFAGDTGMGKTSLLNVLVSDAGDVAPSSQNGACTAAICYFKHHNPSNDGEKYFARIRLKSKATVEQDLITLFHDIKEVDDRIQLEGEDAMTRSEQDNFKTQLKIICGWSKLDYDTVRKHSTCTTTGADSLIRDCADATKLFNFKNPDQPVSLSIHKSKPMDILREVKVYAGATARNTALRWPLTDVIEVNLPSKLLGRCPGLILVDLPGEMDALDARSQVAKQHYSKLDSVMIVTPADRARDNKTAAELIRDDTVCDMEAKGQLEDDSLAVVISKVDQLQWRDYVLNEVEPSLISDEFPAMLDKYNATESELEQLNEEVNDLEQQLADMREAGYVSSQLQEHENKLEKALSDKRIKK
jgi:polyhydroxyalkanoate synthesis regulator phasin